MVEYDAVFPIDGEPCPCKTNWTTGEYHDSDCPEAKKLRDSWCTPTDLAERLPVVDLDPATNARSKIKAKRHIIWDQDPLKSYGAITCRNLESYCRNGGSFELGDGLKVQWNGSIFLNGPYSDMLPFCRKANEEWGAGRLTEAIFLVKLDPTTRWWKELTDRDYYRAIDLWLPHKRLQHVPPPRIKSSTNNFASAIIHWKQRSPRARKSLGLGQIATLWT